MRDMLLNIIEWLNNVSAMNKTNFNPNKICGEIFCYYIVLQGTRLTGNIYRFLPSISKT